MNTQLKWKAEIEFTGDADKFAHLMKALKDLPVVVNPWPGIHPKPSPGVVEKFISVQEVEKILKGAKTSVALPITGIAGGIRDPHLHVKDQVYLVDKAAFKEALVGVSRELVANRVERMTDYADVMTGLVSE